MTQISESRFNMWRAVFAMAHVDQQVSEEERKFMLGYLDNAPFSQEQKEILRDDLSHAQNVYEMLMNVTDKSDQADFFQFANMLSWSDGDFEAQEQALLERLTSEQMNNFNIPELRRNIQEARQAGIVRRAIEDVEFKRQAKKILGVGNMIRFVAPWMKMRKFEPPMQEMFDLWRALFSLVGADGKVTDDEKGYIEGMMDVFKFNPEQRGIIEQDLGHPPETASLFQKIKSAENKKQFFKMAQSVVWCDGEYQPEEKAIIDALVKGLGAEASEYKAELKWISSKPVIPEDDDVESGEEKALKGVVRSMLEFYEKKAA